MMAFRLNDYENCSTVLKCFDLFYLYRVTVLDIETLNCTATTSLGSKFP